MAGEQTIPNLPCRDLDESIDFYEALGFTRTYRQMRPNPFAVVSREDFHVHLFGMDGFDPEHSYGSVVVVVPDADQMYQAFAAGLRARYGKLPSAGIPRIVRPRKKQGIVRGFSVVDPGGNWLRISGPPSGRQQRSTGLPRVIENAARLGDSKGDIEAALSLIEAGLERFPDASANDRASALIYQAELRIRNGSLDAARRSVAAARKLEVGDEAITGELNEVAALIDELT